MTGAGFHLQRSPRDWPKAHEKLPQGSPLKVVDDGQRLAEARARLPRTFTIMRHYFGDNYDPLFNNPDKKAAARQFLNSFVDGSFISQIAPHCDVIEGLNEYLATGMSGNELAVRIAWARALAEVWATEYRTRPELAHIRLCLANTAIGNDIPIEIARASMDWDAYLGYHPYIPYSRGGERLPDFAINAEAPEIKQRPGFRSDDQAGPYLVATPDNAAISFNSRSQSGGVLPGEWQYLSGRWATMDADFRRRGVVVDWLFTEWGPVGYHLVGGGISLHANDGWRHPGVCNGSVDEYLAALDYWLDMTAAWNRANGNRAHHAVLFTSGGGPRWEHFETKQPEMDRIAVHIAARDETPPPPPPPPPPGDDCKGLPRVQYQRVYILLPPGAGAEWPVEVAITRWKQRYTIGGSADDAGIGDLAERIVAAINPHLWPGGADGLRNFFVDNYPGADYRPVECSNPSDVGEALAKVGL